MITIEQAREMGAKGGPVSQHERQLFEAWMAGHCWLVQGDWDGTTYIHPIEKKSGDLYGGLHGGAMQTRMLWAAWRDRAALQGTLVDGVHTAADGYRYLVSRITEKGEDEFA